MKRTVTMAAAAFLVAGLVSPVLALDGAKPAEKKTEAATAVDKKEDVKVTEAKPTEAKPATTATPSQPSVTEHVADKAADLAKDKATDVAKDAAKSAVSPTTSVPAANPTAAATKAVTNPVPTPTLPTK